MGRKPKFKEGDIVGYCPDCNNKLVVRSGKWGKFIGCYGYPECKRTYNLKKFKVSPIFQELRKIEEITSYDELKRISDESDNELIKEKVKKQLLENNFCTCGKRIQIQKVKRLSDEYRDYLKEYRCPECGSFIMRENKEGQIFQRMGAIDGGNVE